MSKKAVLYARVSTIEQKNNTSLEGQLSRMRNYARNKGLKVVREIIEQYSGADPDRPGLDELREISRDKKADVVVFYALDRFMRDATQAAIVQAELEKAGLTLDFMNLPDSDMPGYSLMLAVSRAMAEEERKTIERRMSRGRRDKVRQGEVITHGRSPFGYRETVENGKRVLVIDEQEAKIVRMIFDWYTIGDGENGPLPLEGIRRKLTNLRVPTYADRRNTKNKTLVKKNVRSYGCWGTSSVSNILTKETYIGVWKYGKGKESLSVPVPAIIDRETWEKAQARKKQNIKHSKRNRKRDYLLATRLRCMACGRAIIAHATGSNKTYYECNAHAKSLPCDNPWRYRTNEVDTAVWEWISELLNNPDELEKSLKRYQDQQEELNKPYQERLEIVDGLLSENKVKRDRLIKLYTSGIFELEDIAEQEAQIKEEQANLQEERMKLISQLEEQVFSEERLQTILEFAQTVKAGIETARADPKKRRMIIDALDVTGELAMEAEEKIAYFHCVLGEIRSPIASTSC